METARVLIVDDTAHNVALLERVLETNGIRDVHALTDARLAAARCMELDADLVLLDLHMPHVDGFAVLDAIRSDPAAPGCRFWS